MSIERDSERALEAYDLRMATEWGDCRERVERDPMDVYKESLEEQEPVGSKEKT